jgi:hypothetical protein
VGTTIPRRGGRRLEALLTVAAILVIVAVMALMTRGIVAPTTGGAQDANFKAGAGSALVHDDAGNMPATGAGAAVVHDDAANMPPGAGAAIVHDDAGSVR